MATPLASSGNGMHATRASGTSWPSSNRFLTVRCVTVVPAAARFLQTRYDHDTAVRQMRQSSLSVMPRSTARNQSSRGCTIPLTTTQQSCTVDYISVKSAISRKKITFS
ncbi:hypothetical protein AVEN_106985-1 [Araneus ventricosus]|uniref:Uncharacterized protein n=1 Tax=Araneus ventricosus TaxID=182803 RepID=A0A4Y2T7N4_ARAVE|nr:hypothetical protein AVEN_106985-1 [Araneus ventricosus]